MGITNDTSAVKPLIRISRTEKTIIEIRAQFFSRHRPIPVRMPQTAGSKYISDVARRITRKSTGEPGNSPDSWVGASAIATNITIPIRNVNADPRSARIAITVTPGERFMSKYLSPRVLDSDRVG
jgi:hypothetical protein